MSKKFVELDVELKVVRPASFCVSDGEEDHWVPRSLIDEDESSVEEVGDVGVLVVQEWFAEKEGLV